MSRRSIYRGEPPVCSCGCGELVSPGRRYIRGHNIRNGNASWYKGDEAGYTAIHTFLRKHFPKSHTCDECGNEGSTDYALIHDRNYTRKREDYLELCRRCHVNYDEIGGSRWNNVITAKMIANTNPPVCRCGCGIHTEWSPKKARWLIFVKGHYAGNARRLVQIKEVVVE